MRDIKFRYMGKNLEDGTWRKAEYDLDQIEAGWPSQFSANDNLKKSDLIKLQYTGLKDKNGREIFEGDIVRDEENGGYQCIWSEPDCGFLFDNLHGEYFTADDLSKSDLEIIGNIYENPELLKEAKHGTD